MKEVLAFVAIIGLVSTIYYLKVVRTKKKGASCCGKGYGSKLSKGD